MNRCACDPYVFISANGKADKRGPGGKRGDAGRKGTSFRAFRNSPVKGRTSEWFPDFQYRSDPEVIDVVTYMGNAYIRVYAGTTTLPPDSDSGNWETFASYQNTIPYPINQTSLGFNFSISPKIKTVVSTSGTFTITDMSDQWINCYAVIYNNGLNAITVTIPNSYTVIGSHSLDIPIGKFAILNILKMGDADYCITHQIQ